jgi:L-lactate dehydrogenase
MTGQYGVRDICLSLPCVVGANGVEEVLTLNLSQEEENGFRNSAAKLRLTLGGMEESLESAPRPEDPDRGAL